MAQFIKNAESSAEVVLPFERDEYHAYIRTNIVRIDTPDTEEKEGRHYWQYDEEILTHTEYMIRLEEQVATQKEENLTAMEGLAELYEALCVKEEL